MKGLAVRRRFLLGFLLSALFAQVLFGADQSPQKIHLLFTNDLLGGIKSVEARFMNPEAPPMLSGGAGAYTYVQSVRQKAEQNNEPVLLLDGGDFYSGTILGTYDRGATMIRWMNWMGYDAAAIGAMDFDYGWKNMQRLTELADFPFLSGNISRDDTGDPVSFTKPYLLKEFNGTTVGIVGITAANVRSQTLPSNVEGLNFAPPLPVVQSLVDEVRNKGADIVIVLSSLGLPYDREEEYQALLQKIDAGNKNWQRLPLNALELAHFVKGVDIIATGGNTAGYRTPWEDPDTHTLVIENYGNGTGMAHLELLVDRKSKSLIGYDTPLYHNMAITLLQDDIYPNLEMQDSIDVWAQKAEASQQSDYSSEVAKLESRANQEPCLSEPKYTNQVKYHWNIPNKNKPGSIEIMTWNIEQFPHAGDTTVQAIASVLRELSPDIVAFEEIGNLAEFTRMLSLVPQYDFVISQHSSFYDQAIIYRKNEFTLLGQKELFTFDDFNFAGRPPLQADFLYQCDGKSFEFSVIDLHLKCCGDGLYRRQLSMEQLHGYLRDQLKKGRENFVVLGDWNDDLVDTGINQSFYAFLNDTTHFKYATMAIVRDSTQASYPSWPSFLDQILYSKGLFGEAKAGGHVQTIRLDDYLGGFDNYERMISDHRPVMWSFPVTK